MDKTMVGGVRYKVTTLANIVKYLESLNSHPQTVGETLRKTIEYFEIMIVERDNFQPFTDLREAIQYLEDVGILNKEKLSRQNTERITKLLSLDNLEKEEEAEMVRKEAMKILRKEENIQSIESMKESLKNMPSEFKEE